VGIPNLGYHNVVPAIAFSMTRLYSRNWHSFRIHVCFWQLVQNIFSILGGEYRYLPYIVRPSPICDFLSQDQYIYKDLARFSDFPEDIANNCPLVVVSSRYFRARSGHKFFLDSKSESLRYFINFNYSLKLISRAIIQ